MVTAEKLLEIMEYALMCSNDYHTFADKMQAEIEALKTSKNAIEMGTKLNGGDAVALR